MRRILSFLVMAAILYSCKNDDSALGRLVLKKEVGVLSDSSFLGDVNSLKNYNEHFYISDSKNNRIIVLDTNLVVDHTIGYGAGRGPGEFLAAGKVLFNKDTIYALGSPNGISKFMVDGTFMGYLKGKTKGGSASAEIAIDAENNIYMSSQIPGKHIIKMSLNGEEPASFGNEMYKKDGSFDPYGSIYHILNYNNIIIAVRPYALIVELFTTSGQFLKKIDLSNYKFLRQSVLESESIKKKERDVQLEHIPNVGMFKNKLLIQVRDFAANTTNTILQFSVTSNDMLFDKYYKLPAKADEDSETFGPFTMLGNKLIVFEKSTASIRIYEIIN